LGAEIPGDTPYFDVLVSEAINGIAAAARHTHVLSIFSRSTINAMRQAPEMGSLMT